MPALFAILFAAAVWGASFISTKSLLISGLTPVQIAFVRFSIACMILVGLQILHGTGKWERPSNENPSKPPYNGRIRMMVGGIIGIPVYFLLETPACALPRPAQHPSSLEPCRSSMHLS
ncbi:MAG: EamA family transporter [Firmicutes bacterium]|nr:EamA family transporter [Bacillota bacterium]